MHTCAKDASIIAVTIKDIAKRAGVAHTTVSRALCGNPMIASETAARIHQIAAELGYHPSAAARSLKTSRSQGLGVVVNNQSAEDYRYSIYHDDVDGSHQVTRHLVGLGHQRIAYLGNSLSGRTTLDRLTGFQQEMASAGLAIPAEYVHQMPGGCPTDGLKAVDYFLDLLRSPTQHFPAGPEIRLLQGHLLVQESTASPTK